MTGRSSLSIYFIWFVTFYAALSGYDLLWFDSTLSNFDIVVSGRLNQRSIVMILAIESSWGIVVSIPSLSILRMFVENSPVDNSFNGVD